MKIYGGAFAVYHSKCISRNRKNSEGLKDKGTVPNILAVFPLLSHSRKIIGIELNSQVSDDLDLC